MNCIKTIGGFLTIAALIFCLVPCVRAEQTPIDLADATISEDLDTADNTKPHMSTDFSLYIPPDPNDPVGVIEIDKPESDGKYSGSIHKPFPQTGITSTSTSGDKVISKKSVTVPVKDSASKFFWKDGLLYFLKDVSESEAASEPLQEIKTYTGLPEKSVPETLEITQDDSYFVLSLQDVQYEEIIPEMESTLDHGYTLSEPKAPEQKDITYTDPDTGMELTISAPLVSTEQVEGYGWHPVEFPMRYYGTPEYEIFQLDDTFIPYQDEEPYWQDLDALVLRHLKLSPTQWRITGSEWLTDWKGEAVTGRPVRYGVLYGEMYASRWISHYSTCEESLIRYNATATYVGSQDGGLLATYIAIISLPVLIGTAVGIFLLLIFIILILFLLKRKRGEDDGQCNSSN